MRLLKTNEMPMKEDWRQRWDDVVAGMFKRAGAPHEVLSEAERLRAIRARIERIPAFPVEQEVLRRIFEDNPQLDPNDLKVMRKNYDMQGPLLLEYQHGPYPNTTYLYIHQRCLDPDYLDLGRKKELFSHPGVTVLMRMGINGKFIEIHRWQTDKEDHVK